MFNRLNFRAIFLIVALLIIVLFAVVISLNVTICNSKRYNIEQIEYRTDTRPLIERIGKNLNIEACFWKADVISKTKLGPSSYWMKGFIIIDHDTLTELKQKYNFLKVDIDFEEGVSPAVTGFENYDWYYNEEMSREIIGESFVGKLYLDTNNRILYFDLEGK